MSLKQIAVWDKGIAEAFVLEAVAALPRDTRCAVVDTIARPYVQLRRPRNHLIVAATSVHRHTALQWLGHHFGITEWKTARREHYTCALDPQDHGKTDVESRPEVTKNNAHMMACSFDDLVKAFVERFPDNSPDHVKSLLQDLQDGACVDVTGGSGNADNNRGEDQNVGQGV